MLNDRILRQSGVLGLVTLLLGIGCVGKTAPAPSASSSAPATSSSESTINELSAIQVEDKGSVTAIVISGSKPMSPNIFKLTDPHRIIVDLTDTKLGSVQGPIDVKNGGIGEISVSQFDDASSSLSRVVIGLNEPLEYQVESDGSKLTVKVNKSAGAPSATQEGLPESPQVGLPSVPPTENSVPLEALPSTTPAPEASPAPAAEAAAPVPAPEATAPQTVSATELNDIQYSSAETGTTIRLVANGNVDSFQDMVLSNPTRLVVDLKGIKNAYPGDKTIQLSTNQVQKLRLGGGKGKVRVVMDLAGAEKPAYTIDRDGSTLVVNVAAASSAPVEAAAPASSPEAAPVEPAPPVATPEVSEPATVPEVAAAPVPASTVRVTGLGFKQLTEESKSRVIISMNEPTSDYQVVESGPNAFTVEIAHSRLDKAALKRPINTGEFKTAIVSVTPKGDRKTKTTRVTVQLDQTVPYKVTEEGSKLYVDVDIPAQVARKQMDAPVKTADALPPPPAEEKAETSSSESEANAPVSAEAGRPEMVLEAEEKKEAPPVRGGGKDYRYVREGFMSDAAGAGEPLTEMGAILAGQYRGRKFTGRKISLDFKDADIRSIFRLIADISKLNIIVSDDVSGKVTVRLENVPWDQAFAIILQTKQLWFEKYGNIIRIAPADKLRQEKELAAAAEKASQAAKPLDVLFKPISYAQASDMTKQVQSVLSDRGTVDVDSRTNTLIIKDVRENLDKARQMVDILDTQTPQVTIESRIVEANTNYTRSFGIIWGGKGQFTPQTGNPTGVFFPNSATITGGAGGLGTSFSGLPVALNYPSPLGVNAGVGIRFGSINNIIDLDLSLGLLETKGHAKLISSPKITVLDNKSATISAGSKIPFLTQTANAGSNVRFESATTSISVTPHVTNDGSVSLKISATRNEPNFAQLVQGNPLVDQRQADTEVLVKSGNTTVLGGIYSIRTGGTEDSLPYLSKIPILGWLFKNYSKELKRTELLIFVTPRIVGDEREAVRDIRG